MVIGNNEHEIENLLEEGFDSGDSGCSLGEVADELKKRILAEADPDHTMSD